MNKTPLFPYRPLHECIHTGGREWEVVSANSGKTYHLIVNEERMVYHCSCPGFGFHNECSHGKAVLLQVAAAHAYRSDVERVEAARAEWTESDGSDGTVPF